MNNVVAEYFGRARAVFVGRATTGFYLLLRCLAERHGWSQGDGVLISALVCPSPAYAIEYAGLRPVFADISPSDFNLDPDRLDAVIEQANVPVRAILSVDLFGHLVDRDRLSVWANNRGVFVIHDLAQSAGGTWKNHPVGTTEEIAVLSFGSGKPIDAGGGGAILTDDIELAGSLAQMAKELPPPLPEKHELLYKSYREAYYSYDNLETSAPEIAAKGKASLSSIFKPMYLYGWSELWENPLKHSLETLADRARRRRERARRLRERLPAQVLTHPEMVEGSSPYRYSFLVPSSLREDCLQLLRKSIAHASKLYPPIPAIFGDGGSYPVAMQISKSILNVWVDDTINDAYLKGCEEVLDAKFCMEPGKP